MVGAMHPSHRIMYSLFPCPCRGLSDHWNLPVNRGADSVNLEKVRENLRLVGFKLALAAKQFGHCGNVDFVGCGNILVCKTHLFFLLFSKFLFHALCKPKFPVGHKPKNPCTSITLFYFF